MSLVTRTQIIAWALYGLALALLSFVPCVLFPGRPRWHAGAWFEHQHNRVTERIDALEGRAI